GDDLEFRICGLAPASRELTDPYPARTQLRAWGRLRRIRGCEHIGTGGSGACYQRSPLVFAASCASLARSIKHTPAYAALKCTRRGLLPGFRTSHPALPYRIH
ncbi:hypothetical protein C8R44DRAFT_862960, partial [Mycena epipterygia]